MRYFISDPHFGHYSNNTNKGIITFERTQFKTIQEHDKYLFDMFIELSKKLKPEDELWVLGDWGDTNCLWVIGAFDCTTHFVCGNHDAAADIEKFKIYFDEVYQYPVYLSNKLVVSHIPVAVFGDQINVHGHLHGAVLDSPNYICCSLHVVNYKPITDTQINGRFGQLPKYNRRFLWEPFAHLMKFLGERTDVVMNRDGLIDLSASRMLQKLNKEKEKK